MAVRSKTKVILLFIGDVVALYLGLFVALALRYGTGFYDQLIDVHLGPFTIIFIPWLVIFYISGLYDLRRLRNNLDFLKTLSLSLVTNAFVAMVLFYLVPAFGITPKTNLFIFIVVFAIFEIYWRRLFNRLTSSGEAPNRVLMVGNGPSAAEVEATIKENFQLGYAIVARLTEDEASGTPEAFAARVEEYRANLIVVPRQLKRKTTLAPTLYKLFGTGMTVVDLDNFYEIIMRKVPLGDVEETWFLENIEGAAKFYDPFKRALEFLGALLIGIILLPIEILIALIVKLTSRGAIIYKQVRVGERGNEFVLYKFRTMRRDAEQAGAQWAAQNDTRVTIFGKFLRKTHLDELPQLWNIIKGDISFVGPRPERPEFVGKLKVAIPFYEVRLLVKPGVTGWAQINHRADLTTEDVKEKLQYDIYYLKNRSSILDLAIILKTIKSLFINPE
jgi:exopolysaccharide biosynthesis polyprenyl glycosylphosphotransferase